MENSRLVKSSINTELILEYYITLVPASVGFYLCFVKIFFSVDSERFSNRNISCLHVSSSLEKYVWKCFTQPLSHSFPKIYFIFRKIPHNLVSLHFASPRPFSLCLVSLSWRVNYFHAIYRLEMSKIKIKQLIKLSLPHTDGFHTPSSSYVPPCFLLFIKGLKIIMIIDIIIHQWCRSESCFFIYLVI